MSKAQGTYAVKQLEAGVVYRDVLSGHLVLVRKVELERRPEPMAVGWMWNPVHGAHQVVSCYDHQLEAATSESKVRGRWG